MAIAEQTRASVAYHEAGHAVADCRHGFDLFWVTVQPKGDYAGKNEGAGSWWTPEEAEQRLVGLYAGYAAQRRSDPDQSDTLARSGASGDFDKAADILRWLHPDATDAELQRLQNEWIAQAQTFVNDERNWGAIDALAEELLEHEELDGDEIELVIALADGDPAAAEALARYRGLKAAAAERNRG
ncbi:MAG: hypothetical protein ABIP48_27480 [Planctomycetota bacterium]